jgi:hypothetical protein
LDSREVHFFSVPINFFFYQRPVDGMSAIQTRIAEKPVTYRLNTLSGDPVSKLQVFYLFCKEHGFGDIHIFTLIPAVESSARTICKLRK